MKKVLIALALIMAIVAVGLGVASQMPDTPSAIIAGVGTVLVLGMITDAQTRVSDAQAIVATAVSTNAYDLGSTTSRVGAGKPMAFVISIDVAAITNDANETYEFQIVQATANDLTTGQDILSSQAFTNAMAIADLTAGKRIIIGVPNRVTKRFLGLRYVLAGTTPGITITADLLPLDFIQNEAYYADALTIL